MLEINTMRNYSESELNIFKDKIVDFKSNIQQSINWVEGNLKYDDKANALLQIKNARKTISKIENNLFSKPVIALFGASQVGKSYLIKNLLSISGQPLIIKNGVEEYDFLKQINPPGVGAESTGVVTRFTKDNNSVHPDFPIAVKLLTLKDVLLIVCDSFFLDAKRITTYPNFNEFNDILSAIEDGVKQNPHNAITEDEILDCKEYFDNYFSKYSLMFEGLNKSRYFERVGKIINLIDVNSLPAVFSVLWNHNTVLTNLFRTLLETLISINFDKNIYLRFDAVLRGGYEILDVKRVKELNEETRTIEIKSSGGENLQVNLSYLSSLIAELVFQVPTEIVGEKQFLINSDLLDFPGARSRLAVEVSDITNELKPDLLLRGKVSYLFNKYSDDLNVNSLLFCTNDKQLEVNELSSLLNNWIEKNLGRNNLEREASLSSNNVDPLFVVFTFYNNQLKFDTDNDKGYLDYTSLNYKWENRFHRFFENEVVTQSRNWHREWTKNNPLFQNFYLLRDYKFSNDTFIGFEETGAEMKVSDMRQDYYQKLKESFVNYEFVQKHFSNPLESWELSSTENNDGTEIIIKNLNEVSSNYSKIKNYETKFNQEKEGLKELLKQYVHNDDLLELRKRSIRESIDFQFSLDVAYARDRNNFISLLNWFYLLPHEVYNLLNENIVTNESRTENNHSSELKLLFNHYPELTTASSKDEMLEILKDKLCFDNIQDVESYLSARKIVLETYKSNSSSYSKGDFLINVLDEFWYKRASEKYLHNNLNIDKQYFEFLFNTFKSNYNANGYRAKLSTIFNSVINSIEQNRGKEEFLAEIACIIINRVVNEFDLLELNEDEKSELIKLGATYNIGTAFLNENEFTLNDVRIINHFTDANKDISEISLKRYMNWINKLKLSKLKSCGFVEYDEDANNKLLSILSKI
jgi:hypothetical protein